MGGAYKKKSVYNFLSLCKIMSVHLSRVEGRKLLMLMLMLKYYTVRGTSFFVFILRNLFLMAAEMFLRFRVIRIFSLDVCQIVKFLDDLYFNDLYFNEISNE